MIELSNIKKSFKNNEVLKDVSFKISDGEIVCLLGNNGAGKTTIINCILKMIKPDSGVILLNGTDIRKLKNRNYFSQINALLESSINVYDFLSGRENIDYFAGLMNLKKRDYQEKAEKYIRESELEEFIDEPVGTYSRGMQQKLALIAALISSPKLLLLDEPTLGLDIKSKLSVISILNKIVEEEKISVLLTSHQMDVIQKLKCRILILKNGVISDFNKKDYSFSNVYIISYMDKNNIVQCEDEGSFDSIYAKYKDKEIIEIKKKEIDFENVVMEVLDESD